jgi:hypothetical protein
MKLLPESINIIRVFFLDYSSAYNARSARMKSVQVIFQVKADKGEHRTMNFTKSWKDGGSNPNILTDY